MTCRQRRVEPVDAGNDRAPDHQLHPTSVRNLARHLIGDKDDAQAVHARRQRIEHQKITKIASGDSCELRSEQMRPDRRGSHPQAQHEGQADAGDHEHRNPQNSTVFLIPAVTLCRNRKHAAHNRPREREHHASHHGHRGVNTRDLGGKKCLTTTMSQLLMTTWPAKKTAACRLSLKSTVTVGSGAGRTADLRPRKEIGYDHGCGIGGDHTSDTLAQLN